MKIETLLSAHYIAGKNAMRAEQQGYKTLSQRYHRIGKTVQQGIIRKFERLERQQSDDFEKLLKSANENKMSNRDRFIDRGKEEIEKLKAERDVWKKQCLFLAVLKK